MRTFRPMYRRKVRKIEKLKWARFIETPKWLANTPHRGTAAKGKTYERSVIRYLRRLVAEGKLDCRFAPSPWIEYEDAGGHGIAQPDAVLLFAEFAVVVEVKLKQNDTATRQITDLYGPLVAKLSGLPIVGLEMFKYPSMKRTSKWLDSVTDLDFQGRFDVWSFHWLG